MSISFLMILRNNTILLLALLSANGVHFSIFCISVGLPLVAVIGSFGAPLVQSCITDLAARRWTACIWSIWFDICGSQTDEQYSNVGRTSVLNAAVFTRLGQCFVLRWTKARVEFAFLQMLLIWSLKVIELSRVTPKYLAFFTTWSF